MEVDVVNITATAVFLDCSRAVYIIILVHIVLKVLRFHVWACHSLPIIGVECKLQERSMLEGLDCINCLLAWEARSAEGAVTKDQCSLLAMALLSAATISYMKVMIPGYRSRDKDHGTDKCWASSQLMQVGRLCGTTCKCSCHYSYTEKGYEF